MRKEFKKIFTISVMIIAPFYVLVYLIGTIVDFRNNFTIYKATGIASRLNRFSPSFSHLSDYLVNKENFDDQKLNECVSYYQELTIYLPHIADTFGVLGFCHYHLGHVEKSISLFKKARKINPSFFWFHYNLGIISYNKGDYLKAVGLFKRAINTRPELTLNVIYSSKLYQQIVGKHMKKYSVEKELESGYIKAYIITILSLNKLNKYVEMYNQASNAIISDLNTNGLFTFYQGVALYKLKNYEKSVQLLQQSIKMNPKDADAYYYLGNSLKELGKNSMAQKSFIRADILKKDREYKSKLSDNFEIQIF